MADACQRASASRITAVIPYFGYARQDRRPRAARVPITAKLVANMIARSGIDRVLTVDLHADQIQGFFDIPVDNVYASPVLLGDVWKQKYADDLIVVSPDVGGVVRARALAKRLDDADLAIIDKRRPRPNESEVMNIIGEVDRQDLRADRRHGRYRRHAVPGGDGAEGARRGARSSRTSRIRCSRARPIERIQKLGARRARRDRHDSAAATRREACPEDPPAQRRGAAGRDDAPHQRRGVRELAVPGLSARFAIDAAASVAVRAARERSRNRHSKLSVEPRAAASAAGKGASRRLRKAGKVPADPVWRRRRPPEIHGARPQHALAPDEPRAFFSSILS